MKKILILSIMVGLFFAEDRKEHSFLSDVQVDDPQAQQKVEALRQHFIAESDQIFAQYQQKINALKKQRRTEIESLKESYKNKLKRLKEKYPNKFYKTPKNKPLKEVTKSKKLKPNSPALDKKKSIK